MLNEPQREFIEFVLSNYVEHGVDELDDQKLDTILNSKFGSTNAAEEELGDVVQIRDMFISFQQHLYSEVAA